MLERIRIVLVGTTHGGNIGATARAMKTMGLNDLRLVQPRDFPGDEATARASGADDILASAGVCADLDGALAGCGLVIGTSARRRSVTWPELPPRAAAARAVTEAGATDVAFVFGREHSGLSNIELDRCHYLLTIPTERHYRSLNVAMAVQIVAYELQQASREAAGTAAVPAVAGSGPAGAEELAGFYRHLEETLRALGHLNDANRNPFMRRLHRLFNRTRLTSVEIHLLRGILRRIQRALTRRP